MVEPTRFTAEARRTYTGLALAPGAFKADSASSSSGCVGAATASTSAPVHAMANPQHKSATEVTIAPLAEKSAVEQFVESYWKLGVLCAVLLIGGALYWQSQRQERSSTRRASWARLMEGSGIGGFNRLPTASTTDVAALSTELAQTDAGGWARMIEAQARLSARDYEGARAALKQIPAAGTTEALTSPLWLEPKTSALRSAVDALTAAIEAQEAWEREHAGLLRNPAPTTTNSRVQLQTDRGPVSVTLYDDRAPMHVANFLAKVAEGRLKGVTLVAGGPSRWLEMSTLPRAAPAGVTEAPPAEAVIAAEPSSLFHFAGILTSVPGADPGTSAPDRFALTCSDVHEWDGERVVFGEVTEGLELLKLAVAPPSAPDAPAVSLLVQDAQKL